MSAAQPPDRRIVVAVDMERYSGKSNRLQHLAQDAFHRIMREAAQALGLDREHWTRQYGGDSELAILPAGTPEPAIVARLVPELNARLREHNQDLRPDARVRLRVAIHVGLVHLDGATGFPGEAIVTVCRLVDAPTLKAAMGRFPDAAVGLVVSDQVYRDVVVQGYDGIRADRFARVSVRLPDKGFESTAWIFVPDEDARTVVAEDPPQPRTPSPSTAPAEPATPASKYNFTNFTTHGPAAFGDNSSATSGTSERP